MLAEARARTKRRINALRELLDRVVAHSQALLLGVDGVSMTTNETHSHLTDSRADPPAPRHRATRPAQPRSGQLASPPGRTRPDNRLTLLVGVDPCGWMAREDGGLSGHRIYTCRVRVGDRERERGATVYRPVHESERLGLGDASGGATYRPY